MGFQELQKKAKASKFKLFDFSTIGGAITTVLITIPTCLILVMLILISQQNPKFIGWGVVSTNPENKPPAEERLWLVLGKPDAKGDIGDALQPFSGNSFSQNVSKDLSKTRVELNKVIEAVKVKAEEATSSSNRKLEEQKAEIERLKKKIEAQEAQVKQETKKQPEKKQKN